MEQIRFKLGVMNQWNDLSDKLYKNEEPILKICQCYHQLFAGIIFIGVDMIIGILSMLILYYNVY